MKKAVSLILVIGVVVALFSLAACGDNAMDDVTSMMEEGSTLMSDIGEDLSEGLSEALTDEGTTEDTTEETTEETTGDNTTNADETTNEGIMAE